MKYAIFLLILSVTLQCKAYQMTECELLIELRRNGFKEEHLRDWLCLVKYESNRVTDLILNKDGSRDHGLFQINEKYWCSNTETPGNDCNVTCADVRTDDITKAATCAMKMYMRRGFSLWYGWRNHCRGNLPPLPPC